MKQITAPCKLCGLPAIARFDDHAPQEAVDKFLPMLAHDACYDAVIKRMEAARDISRLLFQHSRLSPSEKEKELPSLREEMLQATKSYAEAIAFILKSPVMVWSEHFADLLIEKPHEVGRILYEYREEVRRVIAQHQNELIV